MANTDTMGRGRGVRAAEAPATGWQHWTPYAAVGWSLAYAALGLYWATGGGFPYTAAQANGLGPMLGRFGSGVAWATVVLAGIPAVAAGMAMLRGARGGLLRPLFIAAGVLLSGILLLLMTGLTLLEALGYVPFTLVRLVTGADTSYYLKLLIGSKAAYQLLCLIGGCLWLAATVSYARRSGDACVVCGRRDGPEGWQSREQAARWGRVAVYIAMAVPIFYGVTRYAWAAGIPLGMSEEYWREGQEQGLWIAGLFLANFGLVGAILILGLVQRWGEVFPRWMIGLAGRGVPIALAVVPASLVSALVFVGGIGVWSGLGQMAQALQSIGTGSMGLVGDIIFQVGPTLLFPVWGVALATATLAYYFRRRGPCKVCGRGT